MAWKGIKEVIHTKSKCNDIPSVIFDGNKNINTPGGVVETFNNFFGSIAESTKKKIIQSHASFEEFLPQPHTKSFFISPTSHDEVLKLILSLDVTKASGPGSVPTNLLKLLSPLVISLSSDLINECISAGVFSSW